MIKISEKDLENILFESLHCMRDTHALNEKGLHIPYRVESLVYRQLNLKEYGYPDIVRISIDSEL